MEQKESRRVTMTKLLLKTALIELMQEKPFPQITIKELCERADLNRTTFYLHYADQTAVLREIENEATQKTIEYMKNASPDAGTVELIERFLSYVKDTSTLSEIRENLPRYGDELHEKYVFIFLMEGSAHIITEWLRSDFDLPTAEIAKTIYALCDSARDLSL